MRSGMRRISFLTVIAATMTGSVASGQAVDHALRMGQQAGPVTLRILTINVWSGVDYRGTLRFGEYESRARRELRFRSLVQQIEELSPDVIFVQEANTVARYAALNCPKDSSRRHACRKLCSRLPPRRQPAITTRTSASRRWRS